MTVSITSTRKSLFHLFEWTNTDKGRGCSKNRKIVKYPLISNIKRNNYKNYSRGSSCLSQYFKETVHLLRKRLSFESSRRSYIISLRFSFIIVLVFDKINLSNMEDEFLLID